MYLRLVAVALCFTTLAACSNLPADWQLKKSRQGIDYFTRQSPLPRLPEYKAVTTINAPLSKVKQVLLDFDGHPEWIYGCEASNILQLDDFTNATLYQVTRLPIIRNRDIVLSATSASGDDKSFIITLTASPDFCLNQSSLHCEKVLRSNHVRVTQAQGKFVLTPLGDQQTQITWTQYMHPAGSLPLWLFRANLAQVPIKTLRNLKLQLEQPRP